MKWGTACAEGFRAQSPLKPAKARASMITEMEPSVTDVDVTGSLLE